MPTTFEQWMAQAPTLETDNDVLRHTYRQSLIDLAALRFRPLKDLSFSLPAAGLPWFMALFGRDSLITAYQALPLQPHLARTSLEALTALQATDFDDFRDAEPGKILHELRRGELTRLGERPHSPYYGTHDATPLFLILLDEYERWAGERDFVRKLRPAAMKALDWIERHGDPDGDGYLEYQTRSKEGLVNQCWKDSWNSILFTDGTVAKGPIATCEIQGYAYDARVRTARLAREIWDDLALADRLDREAATLRDRFNRDYWIEARGHYAIALDGEKRQVDAMSSNVGHLLWSGIVPNDRADSLVKRLMSPEMFTGWGIRTMSASDAGYNPIEYHNGTIWPHDTAFVAEGMRRYGHREQASHLALMLIQAAEAFEYRLPEVFAGFLREETGAPVEYPTASRPQAWAAGAPLLGLRTALGLDVIDGEIRIDPHLSEGWGQVGLAFLLFLAGMEIDLERLRGQALRLAGISLAASAILALAAGYAAFAIGLVRSPLLVGIILLATSLGLVVPVLKDAGEAATPFGQLVIAAATVADFGAVILLSLFFSREASSPIAKLILLVGFVTVIALVVVGVKRLERVIRLSALLVRLQDTTAEIRVRASVVLLIGFTALAEKLGLETILAAFLAGATLRLIDQDQFRTHPNFPLKLEAIGYGFLIPVFFVTSGLQFDLRALFASSSSLLRLPLFLLALLAVRGLPALLYRGVIGGRRIVAAALLQATSLPFIVPAAAVGDRL